MMSNVHIQNNTDEDLYVVVGDNSGTHPDTLSLVGAPVVSNSSVVGGYDATATKFGVAVAKSSATANLQSLVDNRVYMGFKVDSSGVTPTWGGPAKPGQDNTVTSDGKYTLTWSQSDQQLTITSLSLMGPGPVQIPTQSRPWKSIASPRKPVPKWVLPVALSGAAVVAVVLAVAIAYVVRRRRRGGRRV